MDKNDIIKLKKIINNITDIDIINDIVTNLKEQKDINNILQRFKYGEIIIKLISNINNNKIIIHLFNNRKNILNIIKKNKLQNKLSNQSSNYNNMINTAKELLTKLKERRILDNLIFRIEEGDIENVLTKLNKDNTKISKKMILKYLDKLKDINVINKLLDIIEKNKDNGKLDGFVEKFSPFSELFDLFKQIVNMIPSLLNLILILVKEIIPKLVMMLPKILQGFMYMINNLIPMFVQFQNKVFRFTAECARVPLGMITLAFGLFFGLQIGLSSIFAMDNAIPPILILLPFTLLILFFMATDDLYISVDDNGNPIPYTNFIIPESLGIKRRIADEVQDKVIEVIDYILFKSFVKDICQLFLDYDNGMIVKGNVSRTLKNMYEWLSTKFVRIIVGIVVLIAFFKIFIKKSYEYASKYLYNINDINDLVHENIQKTQNMFTELKKMKKL